MKLAHRVLFLSLTLLVVLLLASTGSHSVLAAGVVGTGTPASCTEAALTTALTGGGLVTFNCGAAPATILITGYKQISVDTTIDGGSKITLDAGNTMHFQVFNGISMSLRNIKLSGGSFNSAGSIENHGTLRTNHVEFLKNVSSTKGGAITNFGTVRAKNTIFRKNTAVTGGGAIWHEGGGLVKVKLSTFKGNKATAANSTGGAIANNGDKTIANTNTFKKNRAEMGGAIWNAANRDLVSKFSTFSRNTADNGAAIYNSGVATIESALVSENTGGADGGGISNAGKLVLTKSTVRDNQALLGGGIFHDGTAMTIEQSTLSGNSVPNGDGAGVYSNGPAAVVNSTISGNNVIGAGGGGAWYQSEDTVEFTFTTIANNTAAFGGGVFGFIVGVPATTLRFRNVVLSNNTGGNCSGGTMASLGHNLSSDTSCNAAFNQAGDKNNRNPNLAPLANNGGPTRTHLPLVPSPLINKGVNVGGITTDQRGLPRPVGPRSDIGSVEVQ